MADKKVEKKKTREDFIKEISKRREKLRKAGENLKEHFVGLDEVIDKIIKHMEVWYVMPSLLTRPCIVNLWGMTGVGKTDLVRKLIKEIDFNDNFLEIQMTNEGSSSHPYSSTMSSILSYSNIDAQKPGVILLDEIQRFRSVEEDGSEIHDYKLQDVWMLLSDGHFSNDSNNKNRMYEMLFDILYQQDQEDARKKAEVNVEKKNKLKEGKKGGKKTDIEKLLGGDPDDNEEEIDEETKKHRKFQRSYYSARNFQGVCRLDDPIEDIMQWSSDKKLEVLKDRIDNQDSYEGDDFSKMLVFISGNIDEAYSMATDSDEADVDADLFHKHSKRINMLSIKKALQKRFKPEQIARLGNSHVIYPSLSRSNFEELIRRRITQVTQSVSEEFGVKCKIDSTVNEAIYNNGVFPVQGTRPLFSTISSFFEASLPAFVLQALTDNINSINVFYEEENLCAAIGKNEYRVKSEGDLDKIKRKGFNSDSHVAVSVHEAGHALVYTDLFRLAPTQIVVNSSSPDKKGFVHMHNIDNTKQSMKKKITTFMAGRAAEEIVFGKKFASAGAQHDIRVATQLASQMVRMLGMSEKSARFVVPHVVQNDDPNYGSNNLDWTNGQIEKIVEECKKEAIEIIENNIELFKNLCDTLIKNMHISVEDYKDLCNNYGIKKMKIEILDAEETVYDSYVKRYEKRFGEIGPIATYEDMKKMKAAQAIANAGSDDKSSDKNRQEIPSGRSPRSRAALARKD